MADQIASIQVFSGAIYNCKECGEECVSEYEKKEHIVLKHPSPVGKDLAGKKEGQSVEKVDHNIEELEEGVKEGVEEEEDDEEDNEEDDEKDKEEDDDDKEDNKEEEDDDDDTIPSLHCCVGHTAWAPKGREGRYQAGPKGPKPARRAAT